MNFIVEALYALNIKDIIVHGDVNTEKEFLDQCKKVVSHTSSNEAICSSDPDDFGVTWAEVKTKMDEFRAEYDSQAYARNRKIEYDKLNQLEMQYDDEEDGTTTWKDAIEAIKTKYPKG